MKKLANFAIIVSLPDASAIVFSHVKTMMIDSDLKIEGNY